MASLDAPSVETKRLFDLEKAWNDSKRIAPPLRRHIQMTKDMKRFAFQASGGVVHKTERAAVIRSIRSEGADTFGKLSSTFNFTHHENTDQKSEMKVIKIILVREGQLLTLKHLSEKTRNAENVSSYCSRILEVLAEIRESTLNYLEALCLWRQTVPGGSTMSPRVFVWENKNYTLKIVTDLDFLADNVLIVRALNINPEQFRSNPLMLTNNLHDPNTWMDPIERAAQDAGGQREGPMYETRLKLRYAERILLQEIEINSIEEAQATDTKAFQQVDRSFDPNVSTRLDWGQEPLPGTVAPSPPQSPERGLAQAYLVPLPGLDPNFVHNRSGLEVSLGRPESRNAGISASTPGALARRAGREAGAAQASQVTQSHDSGLPRGRPPPHVGSAPAPQGHGHGQLPPVGALPNGVSHPSAAALRANGMYAPDADEDEFPSPPGGSTPFEDSSSHRPVSRSVLLKSGIEVTPYHTEVVTDVYKYPLLIALLTSVKKAEKVNAKKSAFLESIMKPTLSTGSKSRDDYDDFLNTGLAQMSIYDRRPEVPRFDRLVIKIFDVIGHHEYVINALIAEYIKFRSELERKYEGNIARFFVPEDREWWKTNIRHLIRVQLKRNGLLHMTISKQAIEDTVVAAMRRAAEESPATSKFRRRSTRLPVRRSMIGSRGSILRSPSSSSQFSQSKDSNSPPGTTVSSRSPPTTGSALFRHTAVPNDSERVVVRASALEEDYDDFEFEA